MGAENYSKHISDKKESDNDDVTKTEANSDFDVKKKKRPVLKINTSGARSSANEALSAVLHQLKWRECKTSLKSGTVMIQSFFFRRTN